MSNQQIDSVQQLRGVGVGLVLGGIAFGVLSFVSDPVIAGIGLVIVGLIAWGIEYRRDFTVGVGPGIGVAGVVVIIDVVSTTGFSETMLAVALVSFGIADYFLAPVYGKIQDAGERASGR